MRVRSVRRPGVNGGEQQAAAGNGRAGNPESENRATEMHLRYVDMIRSPFGVLDEVGRFGWWSVV